MDILGPTEADMRAQGGFTKIGMLVAFLIVAGVGTAMSIDLVSDPKLPPFVGGWVDREGIPIGDRLGEKFSAYVYRGHEHCDMEDVTFVSMVWPPGTVLDGPIPVGGANVRQFVRDPTTSLSKRLAEELDEDTELPSDAEWTGLSNRKWRLYASPSDKDNYIYLVSENRVECWPSVSFWRGGASGEPLGCW
jgi:hypothetical protein